MDFDKNLKFGCIAVKIESFCHLSYLLEIGIEYVIKWSHNYKVRKSSCNTPKYYQVLTLIKTRSNLSHLKGSKEKQRQNVLSCCGN